MRRSQAFSANQSAIAAGLPPTALLPGFSGRGYLLFLLAGMAFQMAVFIGVCELALRPTRGIAGSLGAALAGVGRNLPRQVLRAICLMVIGFVVILVVGLMLGIALALLMMAGPTVGVIGFFLAYLPILLLMYPPMHAGAYLLWKDMLVGADADANTIPGEPLVA